MNAPIKQIKSQVDGAVEMMKPKPLPSSLPPVEPFDPGMLPDELRDYVMDVSQRQQSAPEFCAVVALVGLAGVVGDKVRILPKQHDDWQVTPNLWGAMIGGPSSMKSPVLKALRFPLDAIEADMRREHAELLTEGGIDAKLGKMAAKDAEKKAEGFIKKGEHDKAREVLAGLSSIEEPPENPRRLIVNDATIEALGERLNENPNGLTLVRDELSGWLAKMQTEEHASDRAFYLECFNGGDSYTSDRIGRGITSVENCTLSIIGGIQPSKIAPVVRGASRGTDDDGLIQRFQLAVWPDPVRAWQWTDRAPDAQAKGRYAQAFYRLHGLDLGTDEDGNPPGWRFTHDAQELFIQWATEINLEARSGGVPPILESHLLKMQKTVCALALLFALVDGEQGQVGYTSTGRALAWADFLRKHAERLYGAVSGAAVAGAKLILQRRDRLPAPFKVKQVKQKGWAGLDTTEAVQDALDVLEEHGHLYAIETPTPGRPRIDYQWHPDYVPAGGEA